MTVNLDSVPWANFLAPTETLSPRGYEAIRSTVMDGSFYTSLACGKRWIAEVDQLLGDGHG